MNDTSGYLTGQLLVAMPAMPDQRFSKTVIYICAHGEEGAMGLVVNRLMGAMTFPDLLDQLDINSDTADDVQIHFGGPVESGRGFVLHSGDYEQDSTLIIDKAVSLTATVDILRAMAEGHGPDRSLLALGYAGWSPGQLDAEMKANGWLHVPADDNLLFGDDLEHCWERALGRLGIDASMLSSEAGHG